MMMNTNSRHLWPCLALLLVLVPVQARAQTSRLQLAQLDRLADAAAEVVDVAVDGTLLRLAAVFLSDDDPEDAAIKSLIAGLQGIYVKSFKFDREDSYDTADVEGVRRQLNGSQWSRLVSINSRQDRETVEVYLWPEDQSGGLAVVVAQPLELTVVNIVGRIDLAALGALQGKFGIPQLPVAPTRAPAGPR
jgi:hypothetical protein